MKKTFTLIKILIFFIIFGTVFFRTSDILARKTSMGPPWNLGIKVRGFKNLEKNSVDILVLGSSHAYCSFVPTVIWEENKINSYVFATQQQSLKISYFYLMEALKTQNPKVVVVETLKFETDEKYVKEGILRDAIDFLPNSFNKFRLINNSVRPKERITYYFNILKYHNRWKELKLSDFDNSYKKLVDPMRGYVYLNKKYINNIDIEEIKLNKEKYKNSKYDLYKENIEYLDKIIKLSESKGFHLILLHAPMAMTEKDYLVQNSVEKYAKSKGIEYIDVNTEIKFDNNNDFYDFAHLNIFGAIKLTKYFSNYIKKYDLHPGYSETVEKQLNESTKTVNYWISLEK